MDATYPAGSAVVIQPRDDDPLGQKYGQGPDHVRHSVDNRVGLVTSVTGETTLAGTVYVVEMLDGKVLRLRVEHLSEANPATVIRACQVVFARDVVKNAASEAQGAALAANRGRGPVPLTVTAPGWYAVSLQDGMLAVDSFTSSSVLEKDGPEEPAGVWVASQVDPDHFGNIWVDSIHEDEVEAWRALDTEGTRPRVTFVEFGAPVRRIVTETHAL